MWKVTYKGKSNVTVYDSKGIGHNIKKGESVTLDKEPRRESPNLIVEKIDKTEKKEEKKSKNGGINNGITT